jgi:cytochrome c-type biogenesis protein CcmH
MTRKAILVLGTFALLVLTGLPASRPVAAQEPTPSDDEVNAIAKQLYCPVCENVPLDICPTQACAQWRATIREQLARGWSEAQIKQYFVEQYGERVLATPPARGLNWLVYLLPPAAFLGGAYLLFRAIRSWRRVPAPTAEPPAPVSEDPYVARLEEELRRRE